MRDEVLRRCGASVDIEASELDAQSWCEVNIDALRDHMVAMKRHLPLGSRLAPAVKSNGYGHGLLLAARAFLDGGADWLCVHTLAEARALRQAGFEVPIYLFGPTHVSEVAEIVSLGLHFVVYDADIILELKRLAVATPDAVKRVGIHLKIETGNHRQGVSLPYALELVRLMQTCPPLQLVGIASHFANIEDTEDHSFAELQFSRLRQVSAEITHAWGHPLFTHIANSAATLLWPSRALSLARTGIAAYGLWPSTPVQDVVSAQLSPPLRPALSWRARLAQVKEVPAQQPIGYGCTFVTQRPSRIAVVPVGYFEGYDRALSNRGHVLIHGEIAPIRGRICMNMFMVDVTDIPEARRGDIATLLGRDGGREVSAERLAEWCETINYEIVSRIASHLPRVIIRDHST